MNTAASGAMMFLYKICATTSIGWYDFEKNVCLFYCYVYSVGCFPVQSRSSLHSIADSDLTDDEPVKVL